jgi:hypothetical protein
MPPGLLVLLNYTAVRNRAANFPLASSADFSKLNEEKSRTVLPPGKSTLAVSRRFEEFLCRIEK